MSRRKQFGSRSDVSAPVAKSLRDFGYPDVTTAMIKSVLDSWLQGMREHDLPHGIVGMMAGRQFEEVEEAAPNMLAKLADE